MIEKLDNALEGISAETVKHYTGEWQSSGHLYILRLFRGQSAIGPEIRNNFIVRMANLGVTTNVHYKPLPMHTGYRALGFDIRDYPNAYEQFKNEITLPMHTCLSDEDIDYLAWAVKKAAAELL